MRKILFILPLIFGGFTAATCETPVFRYALERWTADNYTLELPASLSLNELNEKSNIEIKAGSAEEVKIYYPHSKSPFFTEAVENFSYSELINSPARDEIVKRIIAGDSVVWVVLTTGDELPEEKILEESLRAAEKSLASEKVELKFSYLQIPRHSKKERYFIASLLAIEADLTDIKETIVFPVFGRGRFLAPLVGKGINSENIKDQGTYLTGACSCEIKSQNPGLDLLIKFDWEKALKNQSTVEDKMLPPLIGTGAFLQGPYVEKDNSHREKIIEEPSEVCAEQKSSQRNTSLQSLGIILSFGLLFIVILKKLKPHLQ
ncbi:MAG: hypothetical protein MK132_03180 [Lentisphaerales bacterium]|nr:hypothetical protein [Lentisphaerales bacterium]